jgi:hypothetical protein
MRYRGRHRNDERVLIQHLSPQVNPMANEGHRTVGGGTAGYYGGGAIPLASELARNDRRDLLRADMEEAVSPGEETP